MGAYQCYVGNFSNLKDYKWTHPVHEVLTYIGNANEKRVTTDEITVNQIKDKLIKT